MLLGYARARVQHQQDHALQLDALEEAGCDKVLCLYGIQHIGQIGLSLERVIEQVRQ